jgi:ADP-ribose pyrophosphatase YjhB (NUDIX family)
MNILVNSYTEKGYQPIPQAYLSEEEYKRGMQCFVFACTDIVPINRRKKFIYLSRRSTKPMKGWWWIGGKMNPDDTRDSAVISSLKREAGLKFPAGRFKLVALQDYRWKDREQFPQNVGWHAVSYIHTVELTDAEIIFASNHLDDTFEKGIGLVPFNREQIKEIVKKEETISAVLDVYDFIFQ